MQGNSDVENALTIDIHTHIMPENLPKWSKIYGYSGFIHLDHHKAGCARMMRDDVFFREVQENCWSGEARIHDMNKQGVDVQVLSTIPVLFSYWAKPEHCYDISRFLNDHIASVVERYPKKYIGLGTIPMHASHLAVKELERCVTELGLAGIEIGSNINDLNLNEPEFFPIYEAAEALGACIFVHPWNMMGEKNISRYWLPWLVGMPAESSRAICSMIFGGVFEKFPKLKVAFAHGGGSFPMTIGRIEHGFLVRPDLCAIDNNKNPKDYLGKFYLDTLVHDPKVLQYLIDMFGANRIAVGSDYPFPLGEDNAGELVKSMNLDYQIKKQLLESTALEWLGVSRERFI
ncbi:MAG: amidohydrolase family protein [Bacteroidota bacterium]